MNISMFEKLKIWWLYGTVFITGASVLIIEILGTRVLAPFFGSTIYVWSSLITITLGALALGYFVGGYFADKYPKPKSFYGVVFIAGFFTALLIKISEPVLTWSDRFGFQWGPLAAALILFSLPLFFFGMVPPFAIRLRASLVEHTGHISGTIFAIATVGSVAGAILTGFYLIPNFFFSSLFICLGLIVMLVALLGLLLERTKWKILSLCVLLGIMAFFAPSYESAKNSDITVLYRSPSFYGDIVVAEKDAFRCLIVDTQAQNCTGIDGRQAFAYGGAIVDILSSATHRDSALAIGLGGGVITRDLREHFNKVDAVEIDAKMVEVAERFFGYDTGGANARVFIADGRRFLRENTKRYDAIVLDAFSGPSLASHLYTKEAFEEIRNSLSADGIAIVNTVGFAAGSKAELQRAMFKTLKQIFAFVIAVSTEEVKKDEEIFANIIFIASGKEITLSIRAGLLARYADSELDQTASLTDARNPIDILSIPIFEESRKVYHNIFGSL